MKTLGEFKKAGLEIIKGDLIDGTTGDKNSNAVCPFVIAASALSIGQSSKLFDGWTIRSFAWRANTGVKPEFSGEIEVDIDGADFLVCDASLVNFGLDVICAVKRWRPHLPKVEDKPKSPYDVGEHVSGKARCEQVDVKPIFTQAMADAGELVKVGMMFRTEAGEYEYEAELVNDVSLCFVDEKGYHVGLPIKQAKPIQTEREKAIEGMPINQDIEALFWEYDDKSSKDGCIRLAFKNAVRKAIRQNQSELYDAGYRKC